MGTIKVSHYRLQSKKLFAEDCVYQLKDEDKYLKMMSLRAKFASRDILVGIIGLGYVGLPLAAAFCKAGCRVRGFDVDPVKIKAIKRGENYLKHLGKEFIRDLVPGMGGWWRRADDD